MSIKPLADRILIQPAEAETKTQSGIYIPDNAKEKPLSGIVKAVSAKLAEKDLDTILESIDNYGESSIKALLYKKINELEK